MTSEVATASKDACAKVWRAVDGWECPGEGAEKERGWKDVYIGDHLNNYSRGPLGSWNNFFGIIMAE